MNVYYFHAVPGFIFLLFKTPQIEISQLPSWSGPTPFSSPLVITCILLIDKNLGEIYYIRFFIRLFVKPKKYITYLYMHTLQPINCYVRNIHFCHFLWPKCPWPKCPDRNILGRNVSVQNVLHSLILHTTSHQYLNQGMSEIMEGFGKIQ